MIPPRKKALTNEETFSNEMEREMPKLMEATTVMDGSAVFA
jgi:hypothetical protein